MCCIQVFQHSGLFAKEVLGQQFQLMQRKSSEATSGVIEMLWSNQGPIVLWRDLEIPEGVCRLGDPQIWRGVRCSSVVEEPSAGQQRQLRGVRCACPQVTAPSHQPSRPPGEEGRSLLSEPAHSHQA